MKKLYLLLFVMAVLLTSCNQESKEKLTFKENEEKEIKKVFPEDFLGVYKGDLNIHNPRGVETIPMEFHLLATDSIGKFDYKLVYNGQARNYTLLERNKESGFYEVDENNGIILPSKYLNNHLYSFFEVQGNMLTTRLEFEHNKIHFEILFAAKKHKTTTGGISDNIPEVFGFPITVVQKAILFKQTN